MVDQAGSKGGLFRKQARARLEAAEKLDTLLEITSPRLWMILVACIVLLSAGVVWTFLGSATATAQTTGILLPAGGVVDLASPVPGTVTDLPYFVGVQVAAQETIATVTDASGAKIPVQTAVAGTIVAQFQNVGNYVTPGEPMVEIFPQGSPIAAVMFVSATSGKSISVGMKADVSPSTAPSASFGTIVGTVASVSPLPLSAQSVLEAVGQRPGLLSQVQALGSALEVVIKLQRNENTPSGYQWTSGNGPPFPITPGTLLTGSVILTAIHPSSVAF